MEKEDALPTKDPLTRDRSSKKDQTQSSKDYALKQQMDKAKSEERAKAKTEEREKAKRTIFIANIAWTATEQTLIELCEKVGRVVNFTLQRDRKTGQSKGFAFCEYEDAETAESAVEALKRTNIDGREIAVHSRTEQQSPDSQTPPQPQHSNTKAEFNHTSSSKTHGETHKQLASESFPPGNPSRKKHPHEQIKFQHPAGDAPSASSQHTQPRDALRLCFETRRWLLAHPEMQSSLFLRFPELRQVLLDSLASLRHLPVSKRSREKESTHERERERFARRESSSREKSGSGSHQVRNSHLTLQRSTIGHSPKDSHQTSKQKSSKMRRES